MLPPLLLPPSCTELLKDDFITDNQFKLVSTSSDGSSYTIKASSPKGSDKADGLSGELSAKVKRGCITLTGKLPVSSSSAATAEAKYEKKVPASGDSKARSVTAIATGGPSVAKLSTELIHGPASLTLDVDALAKVVVASSALAITPRAYSAYAVIGAQSTYSLTDASFSGTQAAISLFDGSASELSAQVEQGGDVIDVSYSHLARPNLKVAGIIHCDRPTQTASVAMATALALDKATTVKASVTTKGLAGLAYIQQIRDHTKLVLSTSFDVTKMDTAKVGAALTFE